MVTATARLESGLDAAHHPTDAGSELAELAAHAPALRGVGMAGDLQPIALGEAVVVLPQPDVVERLRIGGKRHGIHLHRGVKVHWRCRRTSQAIANEMERTFITNDHWYRTRETRWEAIARSGQRSRNGVSCSGER